MQSRASYPPRELCDKVGSDKKRRAPCKQVTPDFCSHHQKVTLKETPYSPTPSCNTQIQRSFSPTDAPRPLATKAHQFWPPSPPPSQNLKLHARLGTHRDLQQHYEN